MSFREPFAAYNAKNNVEAHLVCGVLMNAGIEAMVIEDMSNVGSWSWAGTVSELHKPQVWIEKADIERAGPILAEYDRHAAERQAVPVAEGSTITVICEACGKPTDFPASARGKVENCSHCQAYLDVGDDEGFEEWGWNETPGEEDEDATSEEE